VRLYLDTADRSAAEALLETGLFTGVTTNPVILRRAGLGVEAIPKIYRWAVEADCAEVFFQVWGRDVAAMVDRGRRLRALGPQVVVKLPASKAGARACAQLATEGVPTLLTAVYSAGQALVAAAAGATYLAPYLGKLEEAGRDGVAEIVAMQEVLTASGADTKVLLASVRDVPSMVTMARHGVDCFTMAPAVAEQLFTDELTARAVSDFEAAVRGDPAHDQHAGRARAAS
jgi:transaldolase